MTLTAIRDVLGDPSSWEDQISDEEAAVPDMAGATILDIFVSGNQLSVYTRSRLGGQALSTFVIEDTDLRDRLATALTPGLALDEAFSHFVETKRGRALLR